MSQHRDRIYRIGEMAALAGLSPDTLRYYERQGLVARPARSSGGFRLYGDDHVARLTFIRRAQALGLTIAEIRQLVATGRHGAGRCPHVRDLVREKLAQVDGRLADLRAFRRALVTALRTCDRAIQEGRSTCPAVDEGVPGPRKRRAEGRLRRRTR